jgi:hypothetical protein
MIIQMLKKTVVADRSVAHFCQILCAIASGLVLLFGIRRLAEMDLAEAQLFSELTNTLLLAGVFIVLYRLLPRSHAASTLDHEHGIIYAANFSRPAASRG